MTLSKAEVEVRGNRSHDREIQYAEALAFCVEPGHGPTMAVDSGRWPQVKWATLKSRLLKSSKGMPVLLLFIGQVQRM